MAKTSKGEQLLASELVVLSLGLDIFSQTLREQGVRCAQVDLQMAPQLEKRLADALSKLL